MLRHAITVIRSMAWPPTAQGWTKHVREQLTPDHSRARGNRQRGAYPMTMFIIFMAGLVLGLIFGIILGWSAAPASFWAGSNAPSGEPSQPQFVGMTGGKS
jgi:hypothetical protein